MRKKMAVSGLFVVGMLIAYSGASAADIFHVEVPDSCPVQQMTVEEAPAAALPDLQVKPKEVSACWEVLCFFPDECGHPCEAAYCNFRFGWYGYCEEW